MWDDIFVFAFPENDYTKFDSDNDEYFLGPIVTFKNDNGKLEIIDGQQRLTTLMLLLRAFYSKFGNMKDPYAIKTSEDISTCIWKTNEFGQPDKNRLKIDSEVSTDDDKEEFFDYFENRNCGWLNKRANMLVHIDSFKRRLMSFCRNIQHILPIFQREY